MAILITILLLIIFVLSVSLKETCEESRYFSEREYYYKNTIDYLEKRITTLKIEKEFIMIMMEELEKIK